MSMFELDQKVVVITEKGLPFNGLITGRAKGDDGGRGAYKVTPTGPEADHFGEWYRATDVFLPEQTAQEKKDSWNEFLNE
jgi:hypothetical protein